MKVTFSIQIHSCFASLSSRDVWLNHETDLPFAPFIGLSYKNGDLHIGGITEIVWDHQSQSFMCYVGEDKTFYDVKNSFKDYSDTEEFKSLVQEYLDAGWTRRNQEAK